LVETIATSTSGRSNPTTSSTFRRPPSQKAPSPREEPTSAASRPGAENPVDGEWLCASLYCAKSEADWIHVHVPGARSFIILMNLASSRSPSFNYVYTHFDLLGLDPYPCRSELHGCDYAMIDRYVRAALSSGVPRSRVSRFIKRLAAAPGERR
jgi:hypothetical protein